MIDKKQDLIFYGGKATVRGGVLAGVFCEVAALFFDSRLSGEMIEVLEKYEDEGQEITLWSDDNPWEIETLLDQNDIAYQLYAKRDFAGATVEVAIDNMGKQSFLAKTKIKAKKFIRARDLFKLD